MPPFPLQHPITLQLSSCNTVSSVAHCCISCSHQRLSLLEKNYSAFVRSFSFVCRVVRSFTTSSTSSVCLASCSTSISCRSAFSALVFLLSFSCVSSSKQCVSSATSSPVLLHCQPAFLLLFATQLMVLCSQTIALSLELHTGLMVSSLVEPCLSPVAE